MKKIETFIAKMLVLLTFYLTYFCKVKTNRVAIISYFNHDYNLEFTKLVKLCENENIEVKSDLHKFESSLKGKFFYLFSFVHQAYLFNTSKVVIVDGNSFVHSTIKKKKQVKLIQVWHATGAIKKFGNETKQRRYKIKSYDALIVASDYFASIFSKALSTPLNKTLPLGIMKTDYLFDQEFIINAKNNFYQKYPQYKNKKIILYAPTFRGDGVEDMNYADGDIQNLQAQLSGEYELILRLHPLVKKETKGYNYCDDMDLYTMLIVSDTIISDYSALIYDASLLNKKIIMYLFDLKDYEKNRGLSVDINDFPFEKSYTINDVIKAINQRNKIDYHDFKEKYLTNIDGNSSLKIFNYIKSLMKEVQ